MSLRQKTAVLFIRLSKEYYKMKTSELTGSALDWAVAKCEGLSVEDDGYIPPQGYIKTSKGRATIFYAPSTDWAQGGAIIEREGFTIRPCFEGGWECYGRCGSREVWDTGATLLKAAMRCYVASKLGDDVELPIEFTEVTA